MINASTELYCILGSPVKHSLSPAIQNAAFKAAGINAVYLAFEPDSIELAVSSIKSLNIRGASITIPFKREVLKYLDEIDPLAKDIRAINTIHNINGRLFGYNTDGVGAVNALKGNDIELKNSNVLVLGNGGSARAVSFALLDAGSHVTIAGRNAERYIPLVNDLRKKADVGHIHLNDITKNFTESIDVIINTTSVGMSPDINNMPVPENVIMGKHTLFDIVYSPHKTMFLNTGIKKQCRIVFGIEMLVKQGARQFEIWTGNNAPVKVMTEAAEKFLGK